MPKVCVIKPNDISFTNYDNYLANFTKDKVEDYVEDYISIHNPGSESDFINLLMKEINPTKETTIHSTIIYDDNNNVYQMSHLALFDEHFQEVNKEIIKRKRNGIANILCDNNYSVYGSVLITKSKISIDNSLEEDTLRESDIIDLFRNKKIQKGVLLDSNGSITEVEFVGHPLSWVDPNKGDNYRFYEVEFLGKVFMFFIEKNPTNNILNKNANLLYGGQNPIFGNVFISIRNKIDDIRMTENSYINLTIDSIKKILFLFKFSDFSKEQEPFYYNHKEKKYQNFYNLIDKEYTKYENKKSNYNEPNYDDGVLSLNEITQNAVTKS